MALDTIESHEHDDTNNGSKNINSIILELEKTLTGEDQKLAKLVQKRVSQLTTLIEMHFSTLLSTSKVIDNTRKRLREKNYPGNRANGNQIANARETTKNELLIKEQESITTMNEYANNALNTIHEFIELLPTIISQIPLQSSVRFDEKEIIHGAIEGVKLSDIYAKRNTLYPVHVYEKGGQSYKLNSFTNSLCYTSICLNKEIQMIQKRLYSYLNTVKQNVKVGHEKDYIHKRYDELVTKIQTNSNAGSFKEYTILGNELLKILQKTDWIKLAQEEKEFSYDYHMTHHPMPLPQAINLRGYILGFVNYWEKSAPKDSLQSTSQIEQIRGYLEKLKIIYDDGKEYVTVKTA